MKTNLFEKTNVTSVFNASKKLTADAFVPYTADGQSKYKKISHLISEDPVYLWKKIYQPNAPFGLARCAYGRLKAVIEKNHPHLILQNKQKKESHRNHALANKIL